MAMRIKRLYILPALLFLLLISWMAVAHRGNPPQTQVLVNNTRFTPVQTLEEVPAASNEEKKILEEVLTLFQGIENPGQALHLTGKVWMTDPTDSLPVQEMSFTYQSDGKTIYYRHAQQEVLLEKDRTVIGDREWNRILVGPPKTVSATPLLPFKDLLDFLKSEGYRMEKIMQGDTATVRFLADNHVSCKEIRIRYRVDAATPTELFYRLTDLDHFDEPSFEKTIRVRLDRWDRGSAVKPVPFPVLLQEKGGRLLPSAAYPDATIIDLTPQ